MNGYVYICDAVADAAMMPHFIDTSHNVTVE